MMQTSFSATVSRVSTLTDGGRRVVLDLPEDAGEAFSVLAECQRFGEVLAVTVVGTGQGKPKQNKKQPHPGGAAGPGFRPGFPEGSFEE